MKPRIPPTFHRAVLWLTAAAPLLFACKRDAAPQRAPEAMQGVAVDAVATTPTAAVPPLPDNLPLPAAATGLALPPGHPPVGQAPNAVAIPEDLTPADLRIADLTAQAKQLDGQQRTVRGVVVKVNHAILERNWIHVQDGSGKVVVTSTDDPPLGAVVRVQGKVAADQDVGAGYTYAVLLRDASVTVETAR